MRQTILIIYGAIVLICTIFFGWFLLDTLITKYNGQLLGSLHQDCSNTVLILISILFGLALYLCYYLYNIWYTYIRDGKLFARDMEAIIKLSDKNDISMIEAEEQYLKWCYDRGIRTFRKYVPKPFEDKHKYNKRKCIIDDIGFCGTICPIVDNGTCIGSLKCKECENFVRLAEDKTYVICKAK